uniref:Uncharacterized protein n=1 Tax=Varanus komodoensis TaxID=61221 RepID=A0A8D2J459_VARKO
IIREVKTAAHLRPLVLRGNKSCLVNTIFNQDWRIVGRLLVSWALEVKVRVTGRLIANTIRGIPSSSGLANWSNRLRFIVRFSLGLWGYC